jgi:hypothetical protein
MCSYIHILDYKLLELQDIGMASKDDMSRRLMGVKDELGLVLANLGMGEDVPGGPYVNVRSGVNKQAV